MKPMLIQRKHNSTYFGGWFGMPDLKELVSSGTLRYGLNLDVTLYSEKAKRQNFNFNSESGCAVDGDETADVRQCFASLPDKQ